MPALASRCNRFELSCVEYQPTLPAGSYTGGLRDEDSRNLGLPGFAETCGIKGSLSNQLLRSTATTQMSGSEAKDNPAFQIVISFSLHEGPKCDRCALYVMRSRCRSGWQLLVVPYYEVLCLNCRFTSSCIGCLGCLHGERIPLHKAHISDQDTCFKDQAILTLAKANTN